APGGATTTPAPFPLGPPAPRKPSGRKSPHQMCFVRMLSKAPPPSSVLYGLLIRLSCSPLYDRQITRAACKKSSPRHDLNEIPASVPAFGFRARGTLDFKSSII